MIRGGARPAKVVVAMVLALDGARCRSEEPPAPPDTAPAAATTAGTTSDAAAEDSAGAQGAISDGHDAGDAATDATPDAASAERVRTEIRISRGAAMPLELIGFPGISADGMHVALLVGDLGEGPLALRIARIDGSVLLEQDLLEPDEIAPESRAELDKKLERRLRARIAPAQRVLSRAGMRALGAEPLTGSEAPLELGPASITLSLPGFATATLPRIEPTACATPEIVATFSDREHGVVVTRLDRASAAACAARDGGGDADDERSGAWRVYALTPLP